MTKIHFHCPLKKPQLIPTNSLALINVRTQWNSKKKGCYIRIGKCCCIHDKTPVAELPRDSMIYKKSSNKSGTRKKEKPVTLCECTPNPQKQITITLRSIEKRRAGRSMAKD